jgi:hypothetical protein
MHRINTINFHQLSRTPNDVITTYLVCSFSRPHFFQRRLLVSTNVSSNNEFSNSSRATSNDRRNDPHYQQQQQHQQQLPRSKKGNHIVILGSGWAGFQLALNLNKTLPVTVISPRNHFVFTPLLPSASVGTLECRYVRMGFI